ncbi:IS66 family insertion sequence element accessory protein TnpB [Sorangium sp. So ce1128]
MIPATIAVYLAVGPVDLRGAFDRLAAITRQVLCLDPASGALFLFLNKRRNRLKALWWDVMGDNYYRGGMIHWVSYGRAEGRSGAPAM